MIEKNQPEFSHSFGFAKTHVRKAIDLVVHNDGTNEIARNIEIDQQNSHVYRKHHFT